jgi:hypothetical protein
MTEPVLVGELLPGVLQEVIDRAGPDYDRWIAQIAQTGYCAHPIRLRGTVDHADRDTGEVRTVYDTKREPDATLLKACGNRRVSSAPLARPPTRPTSSICWRPGCAAARAFPRR